MQNNPRKPGEKKKDTAPPENNWAEDQKERDYYYDDAHGYEQFDPGAEEEAEFESESD